MPPVDLQNVCLPTKYLRGKVNEDRLAEYIRIAKDSPSWPFPPIVVEELSPERDAPLYEKGLRHRIIDGIHRYLAATECKLTTIPATTALCPTEGHSYLMQLTYNMTHGLFLTLDERDEAIRTLRHTYKMPLADIAKATHLTQASISRIAAQKQRKATPRTRPAKARAKGAKARAKGANAQRAPATFSTKEWFDTLKTLHTELQEHQDIIVKAISRYRAMVVAFSKHLATISKAKD